MRQTSTRRPGFVPPFLPLWQEAYSRFEIPFLLASPVHRGEGVPAGDGSGVMAIPGLLSSDRDMVPFRLWLNRLGYIAIPSGIQMRPECPNVLLTTTLTCALRRARWETRRKVHLVGHSLGGLLALALAAKMPECVRSVITLGSPCHGKSPYMLTQAAIEWVRRQALGRHDCSVRRTCMTGECSCAFGQWLEQGPPAHIPVTSVYTRTDGVVDWRDCIRGESGANHEVPWITHSGLLWSPYVRILVARRLHEARR